MAERRRWTILAVGTLAQAATCSFLYGIPMLVPALRASGSSLFAASLLEEKVVDQKTLDEIDRKVREEVEDSLKFADESPLPDPKELYTDVYANPIEPGRK